MNKKRQDMQKTLVIVANAGQFAPLRPPAVKPKPLTLARPLPQEAMHTELPDPHYMNQPHGPFWRGTHD